MNSLRLLRFVPAFLVFCAPFFGNEAAFAQTTDEESDVTTTNAAQTPDVQELLRSNLLIQEQLHNALRAIEQARQDADVAAKKNAELFNERLSAVEKSLAEQRRTDLESLRSSNHNIVVAASILGGVGILVLLGTAFFQIRALNRVAEVGSAIATIPHNTHRALGEGDSISPDRLGSAEQSNARFIAAIDQLEKKIRQLDSENPRPSFSADVPELENGNGHRANGNGSDGSETSSRLNLLLTEGQTLLDKGDAENALVYFDQALDIDAKNIDALIKKGTTLEALRKLTEAIETYDHVIALDNSQTVAYLYKGGVLNRLQRFAEAMECYEQALKTHPKSVV